MHQCQEKAYLYYVECKSIHTQPLKNLFFLTFSLDNIGTSLWSLLYWLVCLVIICLQPTEYHSLLLSQAWVGDGLLEQTQDKSGTTREPLLKLRLSW